MWRIFTNWIQSFLIVNIDKQISSKEISNSKQVDLEEYIWWLTNWTNIYIYIFNFNITIKHKGWTTQNIEITQPLNPTKLLVYILNIFNKFPIFWNIRSIHSKIRKIADQLFEWYLRWRQMNNYSEVKMEMRCWFSTQWTQKQNRT